MIEIKSKNDLVQMREACKITRGSLDAAIDVLKPGITTKEIDKVVYDYIVSRNAVPSFLNYGGFPGSACISINEVVIHGIPSDRMIAEGDIVSIDVGAKYGGFHGDCARTIGVGKISENAAKLIEVTRQSFYEGIKFAKPGYRVSDISHAIGSYCEGFGYGVVRSYTGHGVGKDLHEAPEILNFGPPGRGPRLVPGMTLAIEPMVNEGTYEVKLLYDKWTVVTGDLKLSAHYENTILICDGEPEILTLL